LIKFLLKLYSLPKCILNTLKVGLLAVSGAGAKADETFHLEGHMKSFFFLTLQSPRNE